MRNLSKQELVNRAKRVTGRSFTTDYLVLRDREIALNKLQGYQLREIVYNAKLGL